VISSFSRDFAKTLASVKATLDTNDDLRENAGEDVGAIVTPDLPPPS